MSPEELAARLGLVGDLPHMEEALTHPSFSNEQRKTPRVDNQRLEYLGDAVLGLCISETLMRRFPDSDEGELSLIRAALVNADALATWARAVELGTALRLGRGADAAGERDQTNVLADAVEALVGAVYLDLGLERARLLSDAIVEQRLEGSFSAGAFGRDPKSELQERVQAAGGASPRYRVVAAEGPDHQREFVVVVEVEGEPLGHGRGRSKKLAEQAAARSALEAGHDVAVPSSRRAAGNEVAAPSSRRAAGNEAAVDPSGRNAPKSARHPGDTTDSGSSAAEAEGVSLGAGEEPEAPPPRGPPSSGERR